MEEYETPEIDPYKYSQLIFDKGIKVIQNNLILETTKITWNACWEMLLQNPYVIFKGGNWAVSRDFLGYLARDEL